MSYPVRTIFLIVFTTLFFGCSENKSYVVSNPFDEDIADKAVVLSRDDVAKYLGGLPSTKMHCSMLGVEALQQAIKNYQEKKQDKNN